MTAGAWRVIRGLVKAQDLDPVAMEAAVLRPDAHAVDRRFQSQAGPAAARLLALRGIGEVAGPIAGLAHYIWYDRPGCALDPVMERSGDTPYLLLAVASAGPPSALSLWASDGGEERLILTPGDALLFQPGLTRHARAAIVQGQSISLLLAERKVPSL